MTYKTRLNFAKFIVAIAALLMLLPLLMGKAIDRMDIFWLICLPVFSYLLWGGLHGTGRSVRTVGFLGLAFGISYFATSAAPLFSSIGLATLLFLVGTVSSIKRAQNVTESSKAS